jgi:alanine racemase
MRPAWIEVDLAAYAHNLRAIRERVGDRRVLAVVKANGYGHGLVPIARTAVAAGADMLGVALVEEGIALRQAAIRAPILVLAPPLPEQAPAIVSHGLEQVVSHREVAEALAQAAAARGETVALHVKVDSGMGRVGVAPEQALELCREIAALPGARLAGVMTHFATADEPDVSYSRGQLERFLAVVRQVREAFPMPPLFHAANSGAIAAMPESYLDMVRPGLSSYGISPGPEGCELPLRPVMTLKARLTQIRDLPAGQPVGYGCTYTLTRPSRIGILPIGYADGYRRALSNQGEALVRGRRVPIRGRVSMDQLLVDLTDLPEVALGDEAVLLGSQGGDTITAWEIADRVGTIVDEVLVALTDRVPRVYSSVKHAAHSAQPERDCG